ncbi:hypothetical protein HMPREF0202_01548 [Cetobacterium somerae ATCC BAA-474]|uniref:Uncharacterized protein n=1 Tax=Cetobacterium somerae ATCC BAA-474 TaxID=1319815 RepID=U7VAH7_9FUSO|nr:hypothetical protein [Cetobacterium somerae]ERT68555.1 hypothetical protein HMPREF0202_01548 [Cetobacterium somerae ATCC BAA-474]
MFNKKKGFIIGFILVGCFWGYSFYSFINYGNSLEKIVASQTEILKVYTMKLGYSYIGSSQSRKQTFDEAEKAFNIFKDLAGLIYLKNGTYLNYMENTFFSFENKDLEYLDSMHNYTKAIVSNL